MKEIRILLSTSPLGRAVGRGGEEIATGREKERRRLTFMAAGMSSSREFTYSERAKEKRGRKGERKQFNGRRARTHIATRRF